MKSDGAFNLLERDNPVAEDDLPGPESDHARELRDRIVRIDADRRPRPTRRRVALRIAAVGVAVAAIAVGALSFMPGDEPSTVARAAGVLAAKDGTILHTVVVTRSTDRGGSATEDTTESWQQQSAPYDSRQVSPFGRAGRELASNDGRPEAYLQRTNTIYVVVPGTKLPPAGPPRDETDRLVSVMRSALASGEAREEGSATVGGRRALRLVSQNASLLVDAETYKPLEWTIVSDEGVKQTSRFRTYEVLPATSANLKLLSLRAQHPGANVEPGITVEGFDGAKGQ